MEKEDFKTQKRESKLRQSNQGRQTLCAVLFIALLLIGATAWRSEVNLWQELGRFSLFIASLVSE